MTQVPPLPGRREVSTQAGNHVQACAVGRGRGPDVGHQWPEKLERAWSAMPAAGPGTKEHAFDDSGVAQEGQPMGSPLNPLG